MSGNAPNLGNSTELSTASLPDTEVPEDHVENVVNVDTTGEPSERAGGEPQFLSEKILTVQEVRREGSAQRIERVLQGATVPLARHQRCLGASQEIFCMPRQRVQQLIETFAGLRRNTEFEFIRCEFNFTLFC